MRLTALVTVLLLTAGSALACPSHPEHTASNDQTVTQNSGAKHLKLSRPGQS